MSPQSEKPKRPMRPHSKASYDWHQAQKAKKTPLEPNHAGHAHGPGEGHTSGRLVSAIRRNPGRTAAAVIGTAAAGVGTAALIDRHNHQKKAAMSKNLINPFEEVVVFGKAYPVVDVTNVRSGTPKTHTGRGVGHGQRLTDVKNSKGGGGRATKLERYSKSLGGLTKTGYTHGENILGSAIGGYKGAVSTNSGTKQRQVVGQLKRIAKIPKPTGVPSGKSGSGALSNALANRRPRGVTF